MLLHDEILNMCSEFTPTVAKQHSRNKYYASYMKKVRQQETHDKTKKQKHSDKIQKQARRANETFEQSQARKEADKIQKLKTRSSQKNKLDTIEDAMNRFQIQCKKQPVDVCTSYHRLLWKKGVQTFYMKNYDSIDPEVNNLVLAEKYRILSIDGYTYICHTCHNSLKSGMVPA